MSDKQDMAEDRTDWAEDRTILANERTFAGWMRTGMAALGVALGLRALFGNFDPSWVPRAVATLFVLVALGIFWAARQAATRTSRRMQEHSTESQGTGRITAITAAMSAGAVATGIILWFL